MGWRSANPLRSDFARAAFGLAMPALAALALLAATPSPGPDPGASPASAASPVSATSPGSSAAPAASPAAARTLSVVCQRTPLWVFASGNDRPSRAAQPEATLGQRFGLVSGPRTTLSGFQFYETDIVAVEPGLAGQHYWLSQACAIPSR
jgi:hypothetical protein